MEKQALLGVLPPAIITLIFLAMAWQPWKKAGWSKGDWGSAFGVALGYVVADELVRNVRMLWPSGGDMHPHIALLAAIFVVATASPKLLDLRAVFAIVVTAIACALVLRTPLQDNRAAAMKVLAIATGAGVAMWGSCSIAARTLNGARVPLMLWAAAAGNAVVFLQNHSLSLAQMSGALAACMGGFVILGWWRPQLSAIRGAIPVYVLVMLGLLVVGRGFAAGWDKTHWSYVLAAGAVASPMLTLIPPIRKLTPWKGTLIGLLLTLALCIGALALTDSKFDFSGMS